MQCVEKNMPGPTPARPGLWVTLSSPGAGWAALSLHPANADYPSLLAVLVSQACEVEDSGTQALPSGQWC